MSTATKAGTSGPVVAIRGDDWSDYAGREDILLIVFNDERVQMPQFGVEVSVGGTRTEDLQAALTQAIEQMMTVYHALTEAPGDYINEVEETQLRIFHEALAPWVMLTMKPDQMQQFVSAADLVGA